MTRPRLLMLDEPSQGIMPKLVDEIFAAVQKIRDTGVTVLLVEQRLSESLEISDRAYVLQTGRIVMSGPCSEIRGQPGGELDLSRDVADRYVVRTRLMNPYRLCRRHAEVCVRTACYCLNLMTETKMSRWNFWIDRGGTFTDVIGRDPQGGLHAAQDCCRRTPALTAMRPWQGIRAHLGLAAQRPDPGRA